MVQYDESKLHIHLNKQLDNIGWDKRGRAQKLQKELKKKGIIVTDRATRKWLVGEASPKTKRLEAIADIAKTTPENLLTGRSTYEILEKTAIYQTTIELPVLEAEQITSAVQQDKIINPAAISPSSKHLTTRTDLTNAFAITMTGDSMTSSTGISIAHGTMLTIETSSINLEQEYRSAEQSNRPLIVLAIREPGEPPICRRLIIDGNIQILKALNPSYPDHTITENTIIIGIVREAQSTLRLS